MFVALRDLPLARALLAEIDAVFDRRPDLGVLAERTEALRELLDDLAVLDYGKRSNLTAAEMRLMPFLPTHLSFREIGDRLHLSRNTIKTQAIAVYRKLGVSTRGEAIEEAVRLGLVDDTWLTAKGPSTDDLSPTGGAPPCGPAGRLSFRRCSRQARSRRRSPSRVRQAEVQRVERDRLLRIVPREVNVVRRLDE